ncbi:MAG: hypothetical protein ACI94Y_003223 [Maribacter sp.]|jgi:hypothetical protein
MKYFTYLLTLLFPIVGFSQVTVEFDTYNPDDNIHQTKEFSDAILLENIAYSIRVEGTFSPWPSNAWTAPCGAPESNPIFPSEMGDITGMVGHDFFNSFANDSNCENTIFPYSFSNLFLFSTDNGITWNNISSQTYNDNHIYDFELTGEGFPLMIKHQDYISSDNYGKFVFDIKDERSTPIEDIISNLVDFKLFPNPASNNINIDFGTSDFNGKGYILNSQGQQVKEIIINGNKTINIKEFISGIYFLQLIDKEGNRMTKKFIRLQVIS